ncbi:YesL family protein [Halalkalibacter kiskunsagensis]|uniref:YesL family protein n=1 Tax=Halalkalibacter kiskunsagensis TaxID=1548599 RepID=A0ABV6KFM7_9BACI
MEKQDWKSGLARFSEWFACLAYINLLWIGFTLLGLLFLGFVPATVAMFTVLRKWMRRKLEMSIFKEFWTSFKKEFVKSNAAGLILILIGYVLYVDVMVYEFGDSLYQQIFQLLLYILAFVYLLAIVFFFPVYVQFELKWYQYLKLSILMAFSSPFRALWMLFIGYGTIFVMSKIPGIIPFFLGSAIAYFWLMIALPLFHKLELQEGKNNK